MYWITWMYHGRMIRTGTLQHSPKHVVLTKLTADYSILHFPGRIVMLDNMDPVLDPHEIEIGVVDMPEALECLTRHNLDWSVPVTQEQESEIVRMSEHAEKLFNDATRLGAGVYICQFGWDTYGPGISLEANIECKHESL